MFFLSTTNNITSIISLIIISALITIITPQCPFECQNSGYCNNTSCVCPVNFAPPDCSTLGKQQFLQLTSVLACKSKFANNNTCNCPEGFEGLSCHICKTHEACNQTVIPDINYENETILCDKSMIMYERKFYDCELTSKWISIMRRIYLKSGGFDPIVWKRVYFIYV